MWQLSTQRQASHSQEVLGRPVSGGVGEECGKSLQSHHSLAQAQRRGQPCTTERPKAEERRTANLPNQTGKLPVQEPPVRVRDAVAQAIGGMSGRTYEKAKSVVAAARATVYNPAATGPSAR